jgi:electron transfer flavoprotein beta subunit
MRVIVPIKQIRDPRGVKADPRRQQVTLEEAELVINPTDRNALEEALVLKDKLGAKVTVISIGGPEVEDSIREAWACGADEGILLSDELLAKADFRGAALALAKAIQKLGDFDLIIAGAMAADTCQGQLGPRLAAALDIPCVNDVYRILEVSEGKARVIRGWDEKFLEVEVELPAVLCIAPGANVPRLPHGARIMNSYQWEMPVWKASDLGLSEEDLRPGVEERGLSFPPERVRGRVSRGSPEDLARELVSFLRERHLI